MKPYATLCLTVIVMSVLTGCFDTRQIEKEFDRNRAAGYARLTRVATPESNQSEIPSDTLPIISGPLSLQSCIDMALVHNKEVQIARSRLLESDGQMQEAISTALPKASLQGEQMWKDQEIEFSFSDLFSGGGGQNDPASDFSVPPTTYSQESRQIQLLVRQPIYLGGVIGAALDAAKVYTYQVQQQLRASVQSVQYRTRQDYLNVLLARELAGVASQARDNAARLLEDTRKKYESGLAARFDVLRAEVRLKAMEAETIRRDNEFDTAVIQLRNTLGISQMSDIELSDVLEHKAVEYDREATLHHAMLRRPDLLIGEAMVRLMVDNLRSEKAGDKPNVYLQGSYIRSYPGSGEQFGGRDWDMYATAGLVVEWNFFDGLRTRGRVLQAKSKLQQQRLDLQRLEQKTQLEVSQALKNIENAERYLLTQAGNADNAREALRLTRVSYREGSATSLDVITEEVALAQAQSDYFTAIHNYQSAILNLELAMGTLGERNLNQVNSETEEPTN